MHYLLPIIALGNFAAGLTSRAMGPVRPQISQQFMVSITTAATLASAMAVTFALVQIPLGAVADFFGKPRLILTCLILLGLANIAGAFTESFELLLVTRILCGIGAGGVFPVAMGLTGDIFTLDQRRIAISRITAGALTGNLLGSSFSGLLGDLVGWRGVLSTLGSFVLLVSILVAWGFRKQMSTPRRKVDLAQMGTNYRRILTHPHARICYLSVFIEGGCIIGLMPYVASFLKDLGEPRLSIAGIVIGGYAIGGLIYALLVKRMMAYLSDSGLMILGAIFISSQIAMIGLGPPWQAQIVCFMVMGFGFYSLHGGFQLATSEIAPDARASAVSLQAFSFNSGQFVGPILYGLGLSYLGKIPTLFTAAFLLLTVGLVSSRLLRRPLAPDAEDQQSS